MRPSYLIPLLALAGCAAGKSTYYLWSAEQEFRAALALEAESKAIYEYTLAHEYLLKAREEQGYADYGEAEQLARASQEWSSKAQAVAEYGTTERDLMLQEMGQEVPDEAGTIEQEYETPLHDDLDEE
ncbi:MAG: hypothetical protein ABIO70_06315 [Pseudomonadota bacterium]